MWAKFLCPLGIFSMLPHYKDLLALTSTLRQAHSCRGLGGIIMLDIILTFVVTAKLSIYIIYLKNMQIFD